MIENIFSERILKFIVTFCSGNFCSLAVHALVFFCLQSSYCVETTMLADCCSRKLECVYGVMLCPPMAERGEGVNRV
jgi:hypothetical protein